MDRSSDGRPSLFQINCSLSVQRNLLRSNSEKLKISVILNNNLVIDEEKRIKLFKIYSNKSPMIILNIQSILLHLVPEVKEKKKINDVKKWNNWISFLLLNKCFTTILIYKKTQNSQRILEFLHLILPYKISVKINKMFNCIHTISK